MANKKTFEYDGVEYKIPTEREKRFVQELVKSDNQTESYLKAFTNTNKRVTARVNASKLLTKSNVRAYLDMKRAEYWQSKHISTDQAVANLAAIVKAKVTDFVELGGVKRGKYVIFKDFEDIPEELHCVIQSMKSTEDGIEVKFYDKMKAIELILKMQGAFEKDNEQKKQNQTVFILPDNKRG